MAKPVFSHQKTAMENHRRDEESSLEESTWTMYFKDFFDENVDGGENYSCANSSLISDAASFVDMQKIVAQKDRFEKKKRRTSDVSLVSDDLEDTASSPSHSPKVYSMMDQFDKNHTEKNIMNKILEKGNVSSQTGEAKDLKKRGLCLVPVSMLANYLG